MNQENPPSFVGKLRDIYKTAGKEHADTSLGQRATLAATLGGLAFEWGTGNEAMLGYVAGRVYETTHDSLTTALAAGGASLMEQGAIGTLMAMTIHNYPEVTAKIRDAVNTKGEQKDASHLTRYAKAMVLGTGVELATENAIRQHTKQENVQHAMGSAAMIALSNTVIIGGLSGVLKLGERYGLESTSEAVVNVASNPLTYVGLLAGAVGYNKLRNIRKRRAAKEAQEQESHKYEFESQEILNTKGMSVAVMSEVPDDAYDDLWEMIQTGFQDLNRKSYEKQDMTQSELFEDLRSNQVLKYIARDQKQRPVGLLTVHAGLDDVTWTDTTKLMQKQNEVDPDATPYYVGTIVVPVNERGSEAATNLIRAALLHFKQTNNKRQEDSIVFFDCAEANYPWLAQFIQSTGLPSEGYPNLQTRVDELYTDTWVRTANGDMKIHDVRDQTGSKVLDRQHYYAITVDR